MTWAKTVESTKCLVYESITSMPRIVVRTLASRRANGHSISRLEQLRFGNCIVDLCLKHIEEAFLAYLLPRLGPFEDGAGVVAEGAGAGSHG